MAQSQCIKSATKLIAIPDSIPALTADKYVDGITKPKILKIGVTVAKKLKSGIMATNIFNNKTVKAAEIKVNIGPFDGNEVSSSMWRLNVLSKVRANISIQKDFVSKITRVFTNDCEKVTAIYAKIRFRIKDFMYINYRSKQ